MEDPAVYENIFKPFTTISAKCLDKKVVFYQVQNNAAEIEAMRSGRLHVGGFSTGPTLRGEPRRRDPVRGQGHRKGIPGLQPHRDREGELALPEALRPQGQEGRAHLAVVELGHLAPLALFPGEGLAPDKDYKPMFSGKHDQSVLGVGSGDYDAGAVASDVFHRMGVRGQIKESDYRIIYRSQKFPTSSFAYAHDLDPKLVDKMLNCFYDYRFPPEMVKAFDGADRFFPINYKTTWEVVRTGGQGLGRSGFDKATYEKETKREAAEAAKKIAAQAKARKEGLMLAACSRHLSKSYVAGKPVLTDINLVGARGITAVIGPSGTGKSTLIRCINRLVEPTQGEILFDGQDLVKLSARSCAHARRHIGMVFQEYNLVERLTVMENLLSGRLGYVSAWRAWRRKFPGTTSARRSSSSTSSGSPASRTAAPTRCPAASASGWASPAR